MSCRHFGDEWPARGFPSELHPPAVNDLARQLVAQAREIVDRVSHGLTLMMEIR
jgi:hypothetical protein